MSRIGSEDDSIGSGETALTPTSAASASHDIGVGESPSTQPRSQDPVGPGALSTATGVLSVATCATGVAIAVRSATQTLHIGVSGCTAVFSGLWVVDFRNTPADRPRIPSPRFSSRPIRDAAGRMIGRVSGRPAQRTLEAPRHRPRVLRAGFECQPLAVPQPSRRGARCRRGRCPVAASANSAIRRWCRHRRDAHNVPSPPRPRCIAGRRPSKTHHRSPQCVRRGSVGQSSAG
jgi:hypothetical protein